MKVTIIGEYKLIRIDQLKVGYKYEMDCGPWFIFLGRTGNQISFYDSNTKSVECRNYNYPNSTTRIKYKEVGPASVTISGN